jgi:2-methylcitrate dehydratase PrpD
MTSSDQADPSATARLVGAARRRVAAADPDALARQAGLSLFDFASCVRGGRRRIDASWATDGERLALEAHALDRDDLHTAALVHPGGIVWPAVLTSAGERPVSGADAVLAVALGYEVCVAVAELMGKEGPRFWHTTTLAGTVGAAAAAAALQNGPDSVVAAVSHALSVAGGSVVCMLERSETRYLHRAHAVSAGMLAARAASAGLVATRLGIESPQGFLAAVRSDADIESVTGDGPTALEATGQRLYGASGFAHAAIDAALEVRRELGRLAPDAVAKVTIEVSPGGARLAGATDPADDGAAWWSIPHAVAVALTSPESPMLEGGLSTDAAVTRLTARCSVVAARADLGARLVVELTDGTSSEAEVAYASGHPRRALTTEQRLSKWELLSGEDGSELLPRALALGETPLAETIRALL